MLSDEEVRRCVETLEAIVADRARIAKIPEDLRVALMTAAGRVSRPTRLELVKKNKAIRKVRRQDERQADRDLRAGAGIREARRQAVFQAPQRERQPSRGSLRQPRHCYVCKAEFRTLHFFYDSMCQECGDFNYDKRFQSVDLSGKTALITGARVKIGYQAALKLLRAGAKVIVTTRFPHDAALRYAREKDFPSFRERLQIHGLDLRHSPSVEILCRYLVERESRLDILINNAAQTVRRPPAFYAHLIETELKPVRELEPAARSVLASAAEGALVAAGDERRALGLSQSAVLSQRPYAFDEEAGEPGFFPVGKVDADLQQVDLRARNTWRLTLGEVATPEMLEVHLINAVAPFILCGKLKPLMLRAPGRGKHVVNVSAMEGVFSRGTKTDKHPHTNMAKAALNMMTLTSAPDYARDGIHMNAVDTGWVTDEDPAVHAERKRAELDFEPPLDIVDGAARICDPFIFGLLSGEHAFGKFFKDYKPSGW